MIGDLWRTMAVPALDVPAAPPGEAHSAPLPSELASVLLAMASGVVPIPLVSGLSRDLSSALAGRTLGDSELVRLSALLSRATGAWVPSRARFRQLRRQLETLLADAGCGSSSIAAVLDDLDAAFRMRTCA